MYLVDWKGFLLAGKVHVPRRLEGKPLRYMFLAEWRVSLPVGEVHALPAGRKPFHLARMCLAGQLKVGYPRIPAQAGGYPPAVADVASSVKSSRISGCAGASSNIITSQVQTCKGVMKAN
jgi:hypothetical protein